MSQKTLSQIRARASGPRFSGLGVAGYLPGALLTLGALLILNGCDPTPAVPQTPDPHDALASRVRPEIAPSENPWVLAHAILAFGGEDLATRLREGWLDRRDGARFPLTLPAKLGEQHPHLVLKNLAERGLEPELCQQLAETAAQEFRPVSDWKRVNDGAWLLDALPRLPGWHANRALGSSGMDGHGLAVVLLEALERSDAPIEAALKTALETGEAYRRPSGAGSPDQVGTYGYTCSGQHILQALINAAAAGWLLPPERNRVAARVLLFQQRLDAEFAFRQREREAAEAHGESRTIALRRFHMYTLKPIGHGLEIFARAHQAGLGDAATLIAAMKLNRTRLVQLTQDLTRTLDPKKQLLSRLRKGTPGFWQLWFGDACHALRGLELTDDVLQAANHPKH